MKEKTCGCNESPTSSPSEFVKGCVAQQQVSDAIECKSNEGAVQRSIVNLNDHICYLQTVLCNLRSRLEPAMKQTEDRVCPVHPYGDSECDIINALTDSVNYVQNCTDTASDIYARLRI